MQSVSQSVGGWTVDGVPVWSRCVHSSLADKRYKCSSQLLVHKPAAARLTLTAIYDHHAPAPAPAHLAPCLLSIATCWRSLARSDAVLSQPLKPSSSSINYCINHRSLLLGCLPGYLNLAIPPELIGLSHGGLGRAVCRVPSEADCWIDVANLQTPPPTENGGVVFHNPFMNNPYSTVALCLVSTTDLWRGIT